MRKRVLSIFLVLCMVFAAMPTTVLAEEYAFWDEFDPEVEESSNEIWNTAEQKESVPNDDNTGDYYESIDLQTENILPSYLEEEFTFLPGETKTFSYTPSSGDGFYIILFSHCLSVDSLQIRNQGEVVNAIYDSKQDFQREFVTYMYEGQNYSVSFTNHSSSSCEACLFATRVQDLVNPISIPGGTTISGSYYNSPSFGQSYIGKYNGYSYEEGPSWAFPPDTVYTSTEYGYLKINVTRNGWYSFCADKGSEGLVELYTLDLTPIDCCYWSSAGTLMGSYDIKASAYLKQGIYIVRIDNYNYQDGDSMYFQGRAASFSNLTEQEPFNTYLGDSSTIENIDYVTFTPSKNGTYSFSAELSGTGSWLKGLSLYSENGQKVSNYTVHYENGDTSSGTCHFGKLTAVLTAGNTYYLGIRASGSTTVYVLPEAGSGSIHSVTYQLNGGTWDEMIGESWETGETVDIPRTVPTKGGYTFGGWSDGTTTYQPGDTFMMPDHDVTLTAVWRAGFDYSVTYLLNGGIGDVPATGYLAGQTVTVTNKVPTKEGYVFDGWTDGTTTYQSGDTFTMPDHDVTLTAVWTSSASDHSVTYLLNGGTGSVPAKGYLSGQTVTVITNIPQKDGYTFGGWSDGTTTYQPGDTFTMPDHDVTLTAVWRELIGPPSLFFEIARDSVIVPEGRTACPRTMLGHDVTVTWTSANPAIASVDADGTVTGVSTGRTTVTGVAVRGEKTKSLTYSVTVTAGVKVTFKDDTVDLKVNEEAKLYYTVLPVMLADKVTLTSSNPSVAVVSGSTVRAVGSGTVTITATLKYGDSTVTDTCTVNVEIPEEELIKKFVDEALKYVGYSEKEFENATKHYVSNGNWCSDFIGACAELVGVQKAIPKESKGWELSDRLIENGGYVSNTPQKGDIITFRTPTGFGHVGIVCDVDNTNVYVINGNWHSHVCAPKGYGPRNCIKDKDSCGKWDINTKKGPGATIVSYTRPNWSVADGVKCGELDCLFKCPVDVRYTYDGEVLDSATGQMEASFGNMRLTDDGGILVHLNNYYNVEVTINGTGTGTMDVTSTFRDEDGTTNTRRFQGVPITEDTIGKLYAYDSASTEVLEMYNNYGETFVSAWAASGNETVSSADAELTDWYINGDSNGEEPTDPGPTIPDHPGDSNSGSGGSSSSGGSGGGVPSVYSISVEKTANGSVTVSPKPAVAHSTVTLTVKPDSGYVLDTLTVTDKNGKEVKLSNKGTSKYTFIMPSSKVTISASFRLDSQFVGIVFSDVPAGYWAKGAIEWASRNGYMNGKTSTAFDPEGTITRQQLWMILPRFSGQSPSTMAEARTWAINSGVSDGTNPGNAMTRQQMVTFLYRYCRMMNYSLTGSSDLTAFPDYASVSDYAKEAMVWAVSNGIITGTKTGKLNPAGTATRAQFAVILQRFYNHIFSN